MIPIQLEISQKSDNSGNCGTERRLDRLNGASFWMRKENVIDLVIVDKKMNVTKSTISGVFSNQRNFKLIIG